MNSLSEWVDLHIVLVVGAIAVALLLLRLVLQVFQVGASSIIALIAIVLVLNYVFGISPKQLWYEISHLPQDLAHWAEFFT